jgi:hypothetical protein
MKMSKFYTITEIMEVEKKSYMTTNNHMKDRAEAVNMFLTRKKMLEETLGIEILTNEYKDEIDELWGLIKIATLNGVIIELAFGETEL